jgi:hypothetical protein
MAVNSIDAYKAIDAFIEGEPCYENLWDGLNILLMDYLVQNADSGLHNELGSSFFEDFRALTEFIWNLHGVAGSDRNPEPYSP